MQREPIVSFCNFTDLDDEFVVFFYHWWLFYEDLALSLRYCKNPILSFVAENLNLNAPVQKSRVNILLRHFSDSLQRNVNFDVFFLVQKRILADRLVEHLLLFLLENRFDLLIENKEVCVVFLYKLVDLGRWVDELCSGVGLELKIVHRFFQLVWKDNAAFLESEVLFDIYQMCF